MNQNMVGFLLLVTISVHAAEQKSTSQEESLKKMMTLTEYQARLFNIEKSELSTKRLKLDTQIFQEIKKSVETELAKNKNVTTAKFKEKVDSKKRDQDGCFLAIESTPIYGQNEKVRGYSVIDWDGSYFFFFKKHTLQEVPFNLRQAIINRQKESNTVKGLREIQKRGGCRRFYFTFKKDKEKEYFIFGSQNMSEIYSDLRGYVHASEVKNEDTYSNRKIEEYMQTTFFPVEKCLEKNNLARVNNEAQGIPEEIYILHEEDKNKDFYFQHVYSVWLGKDKEKAECTIVEDGEKYHLAGLLFTLKLEKRNKH